MLGNEATGRWMRRSPFDNPQFLVAQLSDWLHNWKERKAVRGYAEALKIPAFTKGQYLFRTRCAVCHTIGQGGGVGPDLAYVTSKRERAWLERWLAVPDQMLAEGDPIALELLAKYNNVPMPNLRLGETDVDALMTFMEAQSEALQGNETTQAESVTSQEQCERGWLKPSRYNLLKIIELYEI